MFRGSCNVLKSNGKLLTYGPYSNNRIITPQSNIDFNQSLRLRNPAWGLRDITIELIPTATKYGFLLTEKIEMPSNNHLLVWSKLI